MIKHATATSVVTVIGFLGYAAWSVQRQQPGPVPDVRLPGARLTIDASQYPSLQAAIDAIPEQGGVVLIPPGEFRVQEPLRISRSDVLLQGAGTASHIINANEQGQPALRIGHPDGTRAPSQQRPWRVMISNLRLTGNPKSGHGIEALAVNELFLQGVTVSYHGGDGIRLDQCYEDPRISDCLITYNKGVGLNLLGCHDVVVSSNQLEENQDGLHCIDGFNLCMTGNCLDDHLGRGVVVENTYGSVIAGNMIEECRDAAIVLDRDCYGITVSANVIAHNGRGVDLLDAHGCAISGNTFTINQECALHVSRNSARITISANNFSNSYIGDGKTKRGTSDLAAAGLELGETRELVIVGNLFSSLRPKAIDLRNRESSSVIFDGNAVIDSSTDHQQLTSSMQGDNLIVP